MTTRMMSDPQVKLSKSIGFRYPLIAGVFLLAAQLLFGAYQAYISYQQSLESLRNEYQDRADFLGAVSPEIILRSDFLTLENLMRQTSQDPDSVYAVVVNNDGHSVTRFVNQDDPIMAQSLRNSADQNIMTLIQTAKQDPSVIEIRAPIVLQDAPLGEIRLGYTINNARQRALNSAFTTLLASVVVAGFLVGLTIVLLNRQVINPLRTLTDLAHSLAIRDFRQRADVSRGDEISALGDSFNSMADQLNEVLNNLEQRVADRTKALATVTEVSTATATILEVDKLLQEVVKLSKERFSLYHAHIYLLDETGANLVLAAGAGEPGRQMVANGLSIPLDREQSLVARAARDRQGVIVNDVTQAPDFLANPLLPDTRSELAVPLIVGDRVLGVFDVQSDQVDRFASEDVNIQNTLASQIAVAIQNARQYEQTQRQAERETTLNTISQKIQSATTVEAVLQIAARELGHALGAPLTIAQLGVKDNNGNNGNNHGSD